MPDDVRILRADDPEAAELENAGWVVTHRSWAAQLETERCDRERLHRWVARAEAVGRVRALTADDVPAVLALDAATSGDYPGGPATAPTPFTASRATPGRSRRGHGVEEGRRGGLAAMTFVDVEPDRTDVAEVDVTVVAREHRGRGLATAVKAASVLALVDEGVRLVRTGGSADNPAALAVNLALGFVVDEQWLTLEPPHLGTPSRRPPGT